jgi:hypothetical protein
MDEPMQDTPGEMQEDRTRQMSRKEVTDSCRAVFILFVR